MQAERTEQVERTGQVEEKAFGDALERIYEAALDPAGWQEVLAATVRFVGAERGALGLSDLASGRADALATCGIDPDHLARWHDEFGQQDPWTERGPVRDEGAVFCGREFLPIEELRAYRVYQEIYEPMGLHDVISGIVTKRERHRGFVSVYRGKGSPLFGAPELERMARLVPHLQRAAAIRARLAEAEGRFLVEAAVLDRLPAAILVCDVEARVLRANARAEALLRGGHLLWRREGRLVCRRPSQERRLRALLQRAAGGEEGGAPASGALPLTLQDERPGVGALVAPLAPREAERGLVRPGSPAALVVVTEPGAPVRVPEGLLRDLHGLTPAEARLAAALAAGRTLQEHAADAGIAVGTARWRLKQVFAKTETRRQAELAGLVLRSVALVDPGV